jgi:hypothetical protein
MTCLLGGAAVAVELKGGGTASLSHNFVNLR